MRTLVSIGLIGLIVSSMDGGWNPGKKIKDYVEDRFEFADETWVKWTGFTRGNFPTGGESVYSTKIAIQTSDSHYLTAHKGRLTADATRVGRAEVFYLLRFSSDGRFSLVTYDGYWVTLDPKAGPTADAVRRGSCEKLDREYNGDGTHSFATGSGYWLCAHAGKCNMERRKGAAEKFKFIQQ